MTDKDSNDGNESNKAKSGNANEISDPSRRRFVKNTGMIVGGVAGGSLLGGLLTNQLRNESATDEKAQKDFMEARMFFTRFEDFVVLEQATERIFPEDDHDPGAIALGVPYFIDKQLAGKWGINGKDYRQGPFLLEAPAPDQSGLNRGEVFIQGLRKLNQISNERFDLSFDQAEEEQQIEILQDFEAGDVVMKGVSAKDFFSLLRETTMEGVYSDPLYGGNKNMEGWKMREFPGAVPSYTNIIEEDEFIKMDPISLTDYQQS